MISRGAIRTAVAAGSAILLLGAGAASASASQTFGSDLTLAADTSGPATCPAPGPNCTVLLLGVRTGNAFPVQSPIDGIVTSFNIKTAGPETVTFRIAREVSTAGFPATARETGPTVTLPGAGQYNVPARVPVQMGDEVGYDTVLDQSYSVLAGCGINGGFAFIYSPALVNGVSQTEASNSGCEHLVNAVVEPDADHDGYGDETQDQCPTDASTQGPCPTSSTPTPVPPPPPHKKCKKKHHAAAVAKKRCKKHK